MKFSDRMGITAPPAQLQVDSMSPELRYSLWNLLDGAISRDYWNEVLVYLVANYWRGPVDEVSEDNQRCKQLVRSAIVTPKVWYECYNVLEEILLLMARRPVIRTGAPLPNPISGRLHSILERELSGFRFIGGRFVPITSDEEVRSVSEAVRGHAADEFAGARTHIGNALKKLGEKPVPDCKGSIRESISAIESVCKKITGEKSGGVEKALAKLETSARIHPRLAAAFKALYDYTSDEDGIRHAMLEETEVGFAEAKFMLVACSAFMNFVIERTKSLAEAIGQNT